MNKPAPPQVRALRQQAHLSFDRLWRRGGMSRAGAYRWLAGQLGIPEPEAHMGQITDPQLLRKVIAVSDRKMQSTVAQEDFPNDL